MGNTINILPIIKKELQKIQKTYLDTMGLKVSMSFVLNSALAKIKDITPLINIYITKIRTAPYGSFSICITKNASDVLNDIRKRFPHYEKKFLFSVVIYLALQNYVIL